MRRKQFNEEEIVSILKESAVGMKTEKARGAIGGQPMNAGSGEPNWQVQIR